MAVPLLVLLAVPIFCDAPGRPYADPVGAHLVPGECRILSGRTVDWATAYATFNLAHEIGHEQTGCLANDAVCEAQADCYAARHVGEVARLTGRTAAETRFIIRTAREGAGFGYRPIPSSCWGNTTR